MKKILAILAVAFLSTGSVASAQVNPGGNPGGGVNPGGNPGGNPSGSVSSGGLTNPLSVGSFEEFLTAILNGIVTIGTIVLIMMLVYVGFLFVVARGNAEKLQSAKSALVWTVIGGLILLGATSIQLVITGTVRSIQ